MTGEIRLWSSRRKSCFLRPNTTIGQMLVLGICLLNRFEGYLNVRIVSLSSASIVADAVSLAHRISGFATVAFRVFPQERSHGYLEFVNPRKC